jgi:hypothetical protein
VHALEIKVADINTSLKFIKGIGVFLATCGLGILGSAFYAVHRATQIEGAVVALQKDTGEMRADIAGLKKETIRTEGAVVALQKDTTELRKDSKTRDDQFRKTLESLDRIEKAVVQKQSPPQPKRAD